MGGIISYLWPPSFRPERDMPDLTGKIALVTGGNTGIGYHTVKQLLLKNAKVYLAARSEEKAKAAIQRLQQETLGKTAIFLELDLADLPSVRKAAEEFLSRENRLDLLFNNGGVMLSPPEMLTAQNHDLQFGTNCIGHFLFTELLLPALIQSHKETNTRARILNTSSLGHELAPSRGIDFVSLRAGPERDAWVKAAGSWLGPWRLYGESKLGNILVSNYYARTYPESIVSCALHPGGIRTELTRHGGTMYQRIVSMIAFPAPMGALTQLWGATIASEEQMNGKYLVPWGKIGKASPPASDWELEGKVIEYLREQTKGF
ncbi:short-chain dehydrogenase/reductase family protein [Favolaschia claudopus]|uniref:Short-chain dehydrogenase/reductase family protein n=1 Tax=Favolaschia claudopus TaxID=2862362 RepID=A0AAW0DP63_9AGAR